MSSLTLTSHFEDLSPSDFQFDPCIGESLRDRVRDVADFLIRRPLYKLIYRNKFSHLPYPIDLVLPEKGMSTLARRYWVDRYQPLKNSRLLIIGCGSAWDFGSYLKFCPREIVGVDLYNFSGCWTQIQDYVKKANLKTEVNFIQADIGDLPQLGLGEFDLICSDAVFEHCRKLEEVLKVIYTLLRPQGFVYASYGPLWYCWGGDHFSGRGGIEQGYNHLILSPSEYQNYYQKYLRDDAYELQNGGRYIQLDLFSHLSSQGYIDIYLKMGFFLESLVVDFSHYSDLMSTSQIFKDLLTKFPHLSESEFLIKGHTIILKKQA
jgi:SAM-dependent methyltransferase